MQRVLLFVLRCVGLRVRGRVARLRWTVLGLFLLLAVAGCAGGGGIELTGEAVSLPPTRTPLTMMATEVGLMPTATGTARLEVTPTGTVRTGPTPPTPATPAATLAATATPVVTPTATPDDGMTSIGALSGALAGQTVTVAGQVVAAESFSGGFKYTLDDGSGRVVLLLWHDVYDGCPDARRVNLGGEVRASGVVGEYEGELQVVPADGAAVTALRPVGTWAEPRQIATVTAADEGRRVMVEGQVARLAEISSAMLVTVGDGSGELTVFVWRNVWERVAGRAQVAPGTALRVVGRVTLYEGALEVIPALPADVVVSGP